MRWFLSFTLFLLTAADAGAQHMGDGSTVYPVYASVLNSFYKTPAVNFPKGVCVNGFVLLDLKRFLDRESTAPEVKRYVNENQWRFLNDVDTTAKLKQYVNLNRPRFKRLLTKEAQSVELNEDASINFSPVIFSKDRQKAFVILHLAGRSEMLEKMVYFLEYRDGEWQIVEAMAPYLI